MGRSGCRRRRPSALRWRPHHTPWIGFAIVLLATSLLSCPFPGFIERTTILLKTMNVFSFSARIFPTRVLGLQARFQHVWTPPLRRLGYKVVLLHQRAVHLVTLHWSALLVRASLFSECEVELYHQHHFTRRTGPIVL